VRFTETAESTSWTRSGDSSASEVPGTKRYERRTKPNRLGQIRFIEGNLKFEVFIFGVFYTFPSMRLESSHRFQKGTGAFFMNVCDVNRRCE
jgi:hypothetical protein